MLSFVTSLVALVIMAAVFLSYRPLMGRTQERFLWGIYTGICIVSLALVLRSLYWDILQGILVREHWITVRDAFGGQDASAIFNILQAAGGLWLLHARVMLIPKEERRGWRWWNVWRRK